MKAVRSRKNIISLATTVTFIGLFLLITGIKSEAAISNAYLTFSATWSGNMCTVKTVPDPPSTNPFLYANAVSYNYNSGCTLLDFGYDYKTTYNTNAIASASKNGVYRARAVGYLTSGSNSTGTSYGYENRYCLKGSNL